MPQVYRSFKVNLLLYSNAIEYSVSYLEGEILLWIRELSKGGAGREEIKSLKQRAAGAYLWPTAKCSHSLEFRVVTVES